MLLVDRCRQVVIATAAGELAHAVARGSTSANAVERTGRSAVIAAILLIATLTVIVRGFMSIDAHFDATLPREAVPTKS